MLYNKFRPTHISQIVGQHRAVTFLKNAISKNLLPHGMILTGQRGTGKTSLARIIAKTLKCDRAKSQVCTCNACRLIDQGSSVDVLELDAASKSNINSIRDIIESTMFIASDQKNKVYIIDEVHMLNKQCFNALLKTLEEPQSNVYFILVTTEFEKILPTIISRCVVVHTEKIDTHLISQRLSHICKQEGIGAQEDALDLIAKISSGSLRDAIVMLEHLSILDAQNISVNSVNSIIAPSCHDSINTILNCLISGNTTQALKICNKLSASSSHIMLNLLQVTYKRILTELESVDHTKGTIAHLIRIWEIIKFNYIDSFSDKKMLLDMSIINACFASKLPLPINVLEQLSDCSEFASILECFPDAVPTINK